MDGHDDITKSLGAIQQWQRDHERHDDQRFMDMSDAIAKLPTKDELKDIIRDTMVESLLTAGKTTKVIILTIATLIGAFAVIGGGFKWLLALFGFTRI